MAVRENPNGAWLSPAGRLHPWPLTADFFSSVSFIKVSEKFLPEVYCNLGVGGGGLFKQPCVLAGRRTCSRLAMPTRPSDLMALLCSWMGKASGKPAGKPRWAPQLWVYQEFCERFTFDLKIQQAEGN